MKLDLSRRRLGLAALALGCLAGCGFKLRGQQSFAFNSIAINPNPGGAVAQEWWPQRHQPRYCWRY